MERGDSRLKRLIVFGAAVALSVAVAAPQAAARSGSISLIRDAETEHTIRLYATPVWEAAGLDPQAVQVHLVNDRALNAFVAGGQRIFIYTGLLMRAQRPGQIIGVLAHETGHISGGHLARQQEALRSASAQSIAAFLLGIAAAAGGSPEAGAAIIMGGRQIAERQFLQYTRTEESSADQAAATYLERSGQSVSGLLEFLNVLGGQEALLVGRMDPYIRTHPVSAERIGALRERAAASRFRDAPEPPEFVEMFRRLQAKLTGYLEPLQTTLRRYPAEDASIPARYARAFAYYRLPDVPKALAEIDSLIAERPNDPFFHEFRAQILFENGRVAEAVAPIQKAVQLAPAEPLLRFALGQVLVATEDPANNHTAIGHLEDVVRRDPQFGPAWQQLTIAYGRDGNLGMSALANAERFLIERNFRDALGQADRATRLLPQGSPGSLRAQDIADAARRERAEERERRR